MANPKTPEFINIWFSLSIKSKLYYRDKYFKDTGNSSINTIRISEIQHIDKAEGDKLISAILIEAKSGNT